MNENLEFLNPNECLLLLIDIQKVLLDLCADAGPIAGNTAALIEVARIFNIPVMCSVQNPGKIGGFLPELAEKIQGPCFEKLEFNCFENKAIAEAVRSAGRATLLLAGIEAHVCIFHTGVGALRDGYRVHVAADAVASRSLFNKVIGLNRLERAGAIISSTEMIMFELLNRGGTEEFRAVLPMLKKF